MAQPNEPWDFLIVTSSNPRQSEAYEAQLRLRRGLGLLSRARNVLVIPDPQGKRIGSGGSTILCLMEVLTRLLPPPGQRGSPDARWCLDALRGLRILILHAGGDSKRLPAYGPCGKIFLPVPGESDSPVGATLFDRQAPVYLSLPPMPDGAGQIVITAGDVLLNFDPAEVRFAPAGLTGLASHGTEQQACRFGVFCADDRGRVGLYLQKPTPQRQQAAGAANRFGQLALDVGVMNFDAATAAVLLNLCGAAVNAQGRLAWTGPLAGAIESAGLDFYREICCALGQRVTEESYLAEARAAGSAMDDSSLRTIYRGLRQTPFTVQTVPRCGFLHFGATRQILSSGADLVRIDLGAQHLDTCLKIDSQTADGAQVIGADAWVEGCRLSAPLTLAGENVVTGVDVNGPLSLPRGACLDVLAGKDRRGQPVWFVRCYGIGDRFKDGPPDGAFCGQPIARWLSAVGAKPQDVRAAGAEPPTVWEARLFPAQAGPTDYRRWLWMFDPAGASAQEKADWLAADRYSLAEIAELADQDAFHRRRADIRAAELRRSLRRLFRQDSGFSAAELAYVLRRADDPAAIVAELLAEAHWHYGNGQSQAAMGAFIASRILHTTASAMAAQAGADGDKLFQPLPGLQRAIAPPQRQWLASLEVPLSAELTLGQWHERLHAAAFEVLERTILSSNLLRRQPPRSALRADEIVWGRSPARLDLAGGWTDTPPYALEIGGCVLNAAVNLNDQPPIHCYARVIDRPVIRIGSIDLGLQVEIATLEELQDYRTASSGFALAKAALALSGFSPSEADWPQNTTLQTMLESFGGGIELTTLAAIPKGSGLGASSIVGAVIVAVLERMMGRTLTQQDLFHRVLRLEQALTTGGGWQDQIGGAVEGVKVVTTAPGLVPDARIHYVPPDVLDPHLNGGSTLLYYTGITRLAKNILRQVVGRYLDRDRAAMTTLGQIHAMPPRTAEAMACKDLAGFGRLIDAAWRLNKQLDPDSSTPQIEALLDRIAPHTYGAKLLGAGGGGFLLIICRSPLDAAAVKDLLQSHPPNPRARFFDFNVSGEGLVVTVC